VEPQKGRNTVGRENVAADYLHSFASPQTAEASAGGERSSARGPGEPRRGAVAARPGEVVTGTASCLLLLKRSARVASIQGRGSRAQDQQEAYLEQRQLSDPLIILMVQMPEAGSSATARLFSARFPVQWTLKLREQNPLVRCCSQRPKLN
jgi:hypothetical protein